MRWLFPARLPDERDFSQPIHDGDTLWVEMDKGHRDKSMKDIRLKGTKAPESGKPGGEDTHQFVLSWAARFGAYGNRMTPWPLTAETFKTNTGNDIQTLNRWTGMVWVGTPDQVRAGRWVACLNTDITDWLRTQDPTWGGGIGG
jgi:hypothetical protein